MKPPNPTGPHSESAEIQEILSKGRRARLLGNEREISVLGIVVLSKYLEVFLHAIQEDHFGSEFFQLGLEFGQHQFVVRTFGIHTAFYGSHSKLHMPPSYT